MSPVEGVLSGPSDQDPLLSKPLLIHGSSQYSAEEESHDVFKGSDQADGAPLLSEATSEIVDEGTTDQHSAPCDTRYLTVSNENLPVSIPAYVAHASGGQAHCTDASLRAYSGFPGISRFQSDVDEDNEIVSYTHCLSEKGVGQEEMRELSASCEYVAYLIHLAVFGILGVLTRYLLQKLFGPSVAGVTSDGGILYLDLPSNMIGSFLMGWLGVVFKSDISRVSDQLATGLSTGYLGSLTTFSGWTQKMLDLSVNGHWVFAAHGFVVGLILAAGSISLGVDTAEGFRKLLRTTAKDSSIRKSRVNRYKVNLILLLLLAFMWIGLWTVSGILEKTDFKEGGSGAQLWLACFVGPFGVWIRWWLSRLNGHGLGKSDRWKWIPFGTLIANVSAACMMAALATVKKSVKRKDCDTITTGIQFGLMGCLSTVSTLMAEFNDLRKSSHRWRAYVYVGLTIGISFGFGTLIYSVPVWINGTI